MLVQNFQSLKYLMYKTSASNRVRQPVFYPPSAEHLTLLNNFTDILVNFFHVLKSKNKCLTRYIIFHRFLLKYHNSNSVREFSKSS